MRINFLLFSAILVIPTLITPTMLPSQTEIWRADGWLRQVRPDGFGNTYFLRGAPNTWYGPDTLFKVNSAGMILWSKPLAASKSLIYVNGEGIYVISSFNPDSVYYFDSSGALQWTYVHPSPHISLNDLSFDPLPLLDPEGNLIFPVLNDHVDGNVIVGRYGTLVKLAKDGTVLFEAPIPDAPGGRQADDTYIDQSYEGPFVDRTGNIWMALNQRISATLFSSSGVRTLKTAVHTEFLLFEGNNGTLRFRKRVYKGIEELSKEYPDGRYKSSNTLFPVFEKFTTGDGFFFGYGTGLLMKESSSPTRGIKTSEQNFWSVTGIDVQGNVSSFKFKGRGKETYREGTDVHTTDGSSNYIYDFWVGDDNTLYLNGEISRGTRKNGVGELHFDYVILKLKNLKRMAWKKVFPDGQPTNTGSTFFHTGEQQIMILDPDQRHLTVIDQNGSVGTTPLSFPDALWRFIHHNDAMIYANTERGVLHAAVSGTFYYGAKYSLPTPSFGPVASSGDDREETGLEIQGSRLFSNYPNPFNPTTTITFDLEVDAAATIRVYNALGQEVETVARDEEFIEGTNEVEFDGSNLPTGIYYYCLSAVSLEDNHPLINSVGKMVIMK